MGEADHGSALDLDRAVLLAKLAICIAALRAGQLTPCLGLLLDLQEYIGGERDAASAALYRALDETAFIWDEPCRPFE